MRAVKNPSISNAAEKLRTTIRCKGRADRSQKVKRTFQNNPVITPLKTTPSHPHSQ
jgi:hypothetical protein